LPLFFPFHVILILQHLFSFNYNQQNILLISTFTLQEPDPVLFDGAQKLLGFVLPNSNFDAQFVEKFL
jgi:hypothetical protein